VFHLGEAEVDALLDEEHPELALFAAWAMQHRHGPMARTIVERAIRLTERLPRALRSAQMRAILSVLSERMVALLREAVVNPDKIPETPAARKFRLFLEARGKQDALLTLLRARGIELTREDEARVRACTGATLDRWIERAATAASVHEVLGAKAHRVGAARQTPRPASTPPARKRTVSRSRGAGATR
jgi:hypothetical protein